MGRLKTNKAYTFRLELEDFNKICAISNNPAAIIRALIKRYISEREKKAVYLRIEAEDYEKLLMITAEPLLFIKDLINSYFQQMTDDFTQWSPRTPCKISLS